MMQGTVGRIGLVGSSAAITLFGMGFMLGLVESPAFPANNRIVSCWFPTSEHGTASALFNSAQYMAVVVFAPLMAWLTHSWGWEHVFIWMGGLGLVATVFWFALYHEPHSDPRLTKTDVRRAFQTEISRRNVLKRRFHPPILRQSEKTDFFNGIGQKETLVES